MQESVNRYTDRVRRTEGVPIQIRVGLNSGEVVVGAIGNDLKMDYTAIGQTVHLASRMEQMATPGSIMITRCTLQLAEGYVQAKSLGPVHVKGDDDSVEAHEVTGRGPIRSRLQAAAARVSLALSGVLQNLIHFAKHWTRREPVTAKSWRLSVNRVASPVCSGSLLIPVVP
jgi:class 3 adenylate cyclase